MRKSGAASSSEYRLFATDEFSWALERLGPPRFLPRKLEEYVYPQLRKEPHFGPNIKRLRSYKPETWRYRIASYRLFYHINASERIVFLVTIDDRKDVYR